MVAYFPGVYFPAGHISLYPQSLLRLTDIRYFTVMFTLLYSYILFSIYSVYIHIYSLLTLSYVTMYLHKMLALSCKKQ